MEIFKGGVLAVWAIAGGLLVGLVAGEIGAKFSRAPASQAVAATSTDAVPAAGSASSSAKAAAPADVTALLQKGTCVACHHLDIKLVGPSWKDIAQRYEGQDVLNELVRKAKDGSQGVWGAVPMPPNVVASDSEIETIVKWVLAPPTEEGEVAVAEPVEIRKATEAELLLGQDLFQGRVRLANHGAACNACHDVQSDAVVGGGTLAKDLTTVFSRLGGGMGVAAILGAPPFPVMRQAYMDKPLTEDEVFSLTAFLEEADARSPSQQPPGKYGIHLFLTGLVGTGVLFGVCGVTWRGRKRQSVYQEIFDRQTRPK